MALKIGLEIHIELHGCLKLFSKCSKYTYTWFDIAIPGTRPWFNKKYLLNTYKLAKLLNASVSSQILFDRKHYIYYDLPSGYQITQKYLPIIQRGSWEGVDIWEAHLEGDAAAYKDGLVDYTRINRPLIEIVTAPQFKDANGVIEWIDSLRYYLKLNKISDASLEDGHFRVDLNLSWEASCRCEVKNLNSYEAIRNSIAFYIKNQKDFQLSTPITAFYTDAILVINRVKEEYAYTREYNIPSAPTNINFKNLKVVQQPIVPRSLLQSIHINDLTLLNLLYRQYEPQLVNRILERNAAILSSPQRHIIISLVKQKYIPLGVVQSQLEELQQAIKDNKLIYVSSLFIARKALHIYIQLMSDGCIKIDMLFKVWQAHLLKFIKENFIMIDTSKVIDILVKLHKKISLINKILLKL